MLLTFDYFSQPISLKSHFALIQFESIFRKYTVVRQGFHECIFWVVGSQLLSPNVFLDLQLQFLEIIETAVPVRALVPLIRSVYRTEVGFRLVLTESTICLLRSYLVNWLFRRCASL